MKHSICAVLVVFLLVSPALGEESRIIVASKEDTETTLLGEVIAHLLNKPAYKSKRNFDWVARRSSGRPFRLATSICMSITLVR